MENSIEKTLLSTLSKGSLLFLLLWELKGSWTHLSVARQLQADEDGYPVFPHPFLGPPHRVKHPINLFTYNAASGGIIKEAVLILNVVPGDTKKADCQPISAPVS